MYRHLSVAIPSGSEGLSLKQLNLPNCKRFRWPGVPRRAPYHFTARTLVLWPYRLFLPGIDNFVESCMQITLTVCNKQR